jgi:hypothetical protein
MGIA